MNIMTTDAEAERRRRERRKELDSILDAALDDLDDDDDDGGCSDGDDDADGGDRARHERSDDDDDDGDDDGTRRADGGGGDDDAPTAGVPYSLEYLANRSSNGGRGGGGRSRGRPRFGPEPPPPPTSSLPPMPPPLPPLDLPPGAEEELAASLEGMMKKFAEELGGLEGADIGDMAGLDAMFQKMMTAEGAAAADADRAMAADDGPETPRSKYQSQNDPGRGRDNGDEPSPPSSAGSDTPSGKSESSAPRKNNGTGNNDNAKEPNVDESINRLLDGINEATRAPLPNAGTPHPGMPGDVDPAHFQRMGEEMMENVMGQFDKMGGAADGNDVVDGVMRQLLDKDLMYEPMREVCLRFPKWLAENKDGLSEEEYERHGTQYQYFQRIVRVYETEPENFDRLMELMQDIQDYGQPPVDIIRDLAPELEFDAEGMPVMMDPGGGGGMMPGMMPTGMAFPGGIGGGNEQCRIS